MLDCECQTWARTDELNWLPGVTVHAVCDGSGGFLVFRSGEYSGAVLGVRKR